MGSNETTLLHLDSVLGEFKKPSECQISETSLLRQAAVSMRERLFHLATVVDTTKEFDVP